MNQPSESLSALILAGGNSSRMGVPKALMLWNGLPLWQHLVKCLTPQVEKVYLVGFPGATLPEGETGCVFVEDPLRIGPLGGLALGLKAIVTRKAFVMACDMPFFSPRAFATLCLSMTDADIVVPHSSDGYHPLFALYDRNCVPAIEGAIARGERRLRSFYADLKVREIAIADDDEDWHNALFNINTPDDLAQATHHGARNRESRENRESRLKR